MANGADLALITFLLVDGDDSKSNEYKPYIISGKSNPKPFVESLLKSPFFEPLLGVSEERFRSIHNGIADPILRSRHQSANIDIASRPKSCIVNTHNRVASWLYQMKHGCILACICERVGWNIASMSRDFHHVNAHFNKKYDKIWIKLHTNEEDDRLKGLIDGFPNATYILDGKQFIARKRTTLPSGHHRRDYYCFKHKFAHGLNAQALIDMLFLCCELVITPGGMPDRVGQQFILVNNARQRQVLVDGGYGERHGEFIKPLADDSQAAQLHRQYRERVEHYFGRLSVQWQMVSEKYARKNDTHALTIRNSFILTNMIVVDSRT